MATKCDGNNYLYFPDPSLPLHHAIFEEMVAQQDNPSVGGLKPFKFVAPNGDEGDVVELDLLSSTIVDIGDPKYDVAIGFRWLAHDRYVDEGPEGKFIEYGEEFMNFLSYVGLALRRLQRPIKNVVFIQVRNADTSVVSTDGTSVDILYTVVIRAQWALPNHIRTVNA